MKLSVKIPLFFGIIIAVISISISAAIIMISSNILNDTILEAIEAETDANAHFVGERMNRHLDIIGEIAARARTRTMDVESVVPSLVVDVDRIGVMELALVLPNGQAHLAKSNTIIDISDRDYFKNAMRGERSANIIPNRNTNTVATMLIVPIYESDALNARIVGALLCQEDGMQLSALSNILDTSMSTGRYFIVDAEGIVIAHASPNMVINQFNPIVEARTDKAWETLGRSISMAISQPNGFTNYTYAGSDALSYFVKVDGFPWTLFFSMDKEEFDGKINQLTFSAIGISLGLLAVALVLAFIIGRSIAKPIRNVAENLKDIAQGEGDLTRTIPEKGNDEIADLSRYFNQTLEKIKNLIILIKSETETLASIGNNLSSNMIETASAVNEITANIQSIKGRIINQSASVTETNATMEQVTVNIGKLDGNVQDQSSHISQASAAIEEMVANIASVSETLNKNSTNVKNLKDASEVGRTGLSEVASDIQVIARESEGLMEINSVMENIASQTNLLSMNAAIEAAHAGEAGKGFAVVADEIRKLAESSSEQSKTISTVLKKMKESIDKITRSTENVMNRFEAIDSNVKTVAEQEDIIRNAMEEQKTGSSQLLGGISKVNEITRDVSRGSHEMLDGAKEVIHESKNLEKATQEITSGMNEMAAGANQINVAVNHVNEITVKNRDGIDILLHEVSRFKVK